IAAAEAYVSAATAPESHFDPERAHQQLTRAIDLLRAQPSATEQDMLLARATFEVVRFGAQLGHNDRLKRILDSVAPRLEPHPITRVALDSARAWLHYMRGDLAEAIMLSQRCLDADVELTERFRMAPTNIVGRALCAAGRFTRAAEILTHACILARDAEEFGELCHSKGMLALALGFHGQLARAERELIEARSVANALHDPARILGAMCYNAIAAEFLHDWDRGVRASVELLRYAEEQRIGGL